MYWSWFPRPSSILEVSIENHAVQLLQWCYWGMSDVPINPSHKSHNALHKNLTMLNFITGTCTFLLQNCALWDVELVKNGVCATGLFENLESRMRPAAELALVNVHCPITMHVFLPRISSVTHPTWVKLDTATLHICSTTFHGHLPMFATCCCHYSDRYIRQSYCPVSIIARPWCLSYIIHTVAKYKRRHVGPIWMISDCQNI